MTVTLFFFFFFFFDKTGSLNQAILQGPWSA